MEFNLIVKLIFKFYFIVSLQEEILKRYLKNNYKGFAFWVKAH